jgi:hypothetical protein
MDVDRFNQLACLIYRMPSPPVQGRKVPKAERMSKNAAA